MQPGTATLDFGGSLLRTQLLERRQRLETAITQYRQPAQLMELLGEVDSALERMKDGSYGICKACHEPIESARLVSNPLTEFCLDHLTGAERRALEQDLHMASQIQAALLPRRQLVFGGWDLYYHYEPAGAVSGDYCDLVEEASGDLFFLFGDVAGKGIAASILTAHLHAMFRALIASGLPLSQLLERSNSLFCESTMPASYATLVCGCADRSGGIEISNAGHCPPLVIRRDGSETIDAGGLPLGLFANSQYSVQSINLESTDSLLLYTDGLSEARDPSGAEYGAARLRKLAAAHSPSAEALTSTCLHDLRTFQSGTPNADDLTIMAIRRA